MWVVPASQPFAKRIESAAMKKAFGLACLFSILTGTVFGQTAAGGAKAGIGRVFDGAGRSAAARELQSKMNGNLLKMAVTRSKAAKAKPAKGKPTETASTAARRSSAVPAPSYTEFRPSNDTDFVDRFASSLSTDASERQLVKTLVTGVRDAFEQEVAKKGRPNNLAAAFTFFVASTVMVYHDDPEPSDEAVDRLWDALDETMNGLPEMSRLSNAEKQEMYEMLVACGGLVLAGHVYAKQNNDRNAAAVYRQLAGELIKTVLQSDPDNIRFNSGGLNFAS